ncbi:MAG TPA: zf-HC2 domain-containing protein [Terriglobales bacterium]|nr:zf-HC2 domain-containing protein [Terriglobales bacterium]
MSVLEISCVEVWREVSNYIDGEITLDLRTRIEAHCKACAHCTAILDGTKNVVRLIANGIQYDLPGGFSRRLYDKLKNK